MTQKLEWLPLYCLGDYTIDSQHQYLFELANTVLDSDDWQLLGSAVMVLFQYTRKHFHDEEELMVKRHYADLDLHRSEHNVLIGMLTALPTPCEENQSKLKRDVHSIMMFWILKHIIDEDSKIPLD